MAYDSCYKVIENKSKITYSYDNTERIITKNDVSNTTSIKVCEFYYYYKECIKNILSIRGLCINRCSLAGIDVRCEVDIKDCYIKYYNGNRDLIVDFELYISIYNNRRYKKSIEYCKNYEYEIQIDDFDVYDININIDDVEFVVLRDGNIGVCTFIEIKF